MVLARCRNLLFKGRHELRRPGCKVSVGLGSDGVMTLRQSAKKLVKGLRLSLSCSGLRFGCRLRLGVFLCLTISFYGPLSSLPLTFAGFTEST